MTLPRVRLGELLVDARVITREQLDEVLALQERDPRRLGTLLVESGLVSETQVTQILSQQLSVPWVSLQHIDFSPQLLDLVPRELADRHCLVPIFVRRVRGVGETVYVAMDDPSNEEALNQVSKTAVLPVRAMIAPPSHIRAAIASYYGPGAAGPEPVAADAAAAGPSLEPAARATPTPTPEPSASEPNSVGAEAAAPEPAVSENALDAVPPAHSGAGLPSLAFAPESLPVSQVQPVDPMIVDRVVFEPGTPMGDAAPAVNGEPEVAAEPESSDEMRPANGSGAPATRRSGARSIDGPESAPEIETREIPLQHAGRPGGRMVTLTLLDGTQVNVPVRRHAARPPSDVAPNDARGRELLAALRAVARGADPSQAVGDAQWQELFTLLVRVLLKKRLITEAELIAEIEKT